MLGAKEKEGGDKVENQELEAESFHCRWDNISEWGRAYGM
jgi:hypothetical protein